MPHLSPILWAWVVLMFLVILMIYISFFWWLQFSKINISFMEEKLKENSWKW